MLPIRDHLPTRRVPFVNYSLIAANVAVFVLIAEKVGRGVDPEAAIQPWALVPARLLADPLGHGASLFTHLFLHASLAHIGGNMLFLWIFGDNVEDAMGHLRYSAFYVVCGFAAALAQVAVAPHSHVPMLGASGAIAGVLAAYGFLYPRSPIMVINPIPLLWLVWGLTISFPAWLVILEFFAANLWSALQPTSRSGGVAFMAHVGGFLAGAALLRSFLPTRERAQHDRWQPARRERAWRS